MLSKLHINLRAVFNGLLLLGAFINLGLLFSRNLLEPSLSPAGYRALIEEMVSIEKLKRMLIKDDAYSRSLEDFVSTLHSILLSIYGVVAIFALIHLVLIYCRKRGSRPPAYGSIAVSLQRSIDGSDSMVGLVLIDTIDK